MIVLVQRCLRGSVEVDGVTVGEIGSGLTVFVGFQPGDADSLDEKLVSKLLAMRVFADDAGKMNKSVVDTGGNILLIPNFTLAADTSGGNRPSFTTAMPPDQARPRFERLVGLLTARWSNTRSGRFGADMKIRVLNDGPVNLILRLA
jgi:D-tyrosyl-tRNA(Tyr) deacylase